MAVKQQQQEQDEPGSILLQVWRSHVVSMLRPGAEMVWLLLLDVATALMNVWGPLRKLCLTSDVWSQIKEPSLGQWDPGCGMCSADQGSFPCLVLVFMTDN